MKAYSVPVDRRDEKGCRNMKFTPQQGAPFANYILREAAKNAAAFIPGLMFARKRLFSTQNDPIDLVFGRHRVEWDCYRQVLDRLGIEFTGMCIAELGPGPVLGNAVYFVANGAASYTGIDRYPLLRDDLTVRRAYDALVRSFSQEQRARCDRLIGSNSAAPLFESRIKMLKLMVEQAGERLAPRTFDLIVSFNFLEHVDDVRRVLASIRSLLKPTGLMLHRVDVSTHGRISMGHHPLAQLTVPRAIWRLMGSRRALPNRVRPSDVLSTAHQCGFKTILYEVTDRMLDEEVESFRPLLNREFRSYSIEDLGTLDFLWVARPC